MLNEQLHFLTNRPVLAKISLTCEGTDNGANE